MRVSFVLSLYLKAFAILLAAFNVAANAAVTPPQSPLDRPVDEIKTMVAATAGCEWSTPEPFMGLIHHVCRGPKKLRLDTWIHMWVRPDGLIDRIEFLPVVNEFVSVDGVTGKLHVTETTKAQERLMSNLMAAFFPSWGGSRQWISNAMQGCLKELFHASIRVGGTSIYVTQSSYVSREEYNAFTVLTRKTDLTEFKSWDCRDDEQGPGLDSCTERDGPRPPDNPILHPM